MIQILIGRVRIDMPWMPIPDPGPLCMLSFLTVLRIRIIRIQYLFNPLIWDPGWVKK
jgi:hypothetical protein